MPLLVIIYINQVHQMFMDILETKTMQWLFLFSPLLIGQKDLLYIKETWFVYNYNFFIKLL